MKKTAVLTLLLFVVHFAAGQDNGPNEITPQILQKIKADIEKQIPQLKQKLTKQDFSADRIEFSLDTFRIDQVMVKRMELDYSTMGMNASVEERTVAYDKLMNKYYGKLIKILSPEDKKVLVTAQKAWLSYRDAETKLIATMTKEEYSGGGTIQSNIAVGSYSDLIEKRTLEIFNYYDGIIKEE